jgi:hypothetical protein
MWRNPFATPREGHSQPPTKDNKAAKVQRNSFKKREIEGQYNEVELEGEVCSMMKVA